ncbi:MAG: homoserine dehydrogenase [Planctomycetia bacterium]|nr:homoserine dehydrogenase [Planctomycetia bacterium]
MAVAEPVRVGVVGLGTVGSGVVRLLVESADHIERHAGRPIVVARAAVKDLAKARSVEVPGGHLSADWRDVSRDPAISVAALLVGGLEPARTIMIDLLEHGKDVVTANKALLAEHGPELFELARRRGRSIAFEAAVAGGIPIVAAIGECLAANRIESIRGILNGTSNFIVTRMEEDGADYAHVLRLAQQKGYAEADPAMDVDGTDATQKLAILAHLAFGAWVPWAEIPRTGIDGLDLDLITYAGELGYRIRLVAVAGRSDGRLAMRVAPALVKRGTPLAETRGAYNAVSIVGDAVGRMFFHGLGAGQMPTASAVVADIIDTVVGRAAITFRTTGVLSADTPAARIAGVDMQERHFLRIRAQDRPGVLARITGILGEHGISIASMIQHDAGAADGTVPLVIMTHPCGSTAIRKALDHIDASDVVSGRSVCLSVLDE